jgi:RecA-family ATPase
MRFPGKFPVALVVQAEQPKTTDETGWVSQTLSTPAKQGKRNDTLCSLAGYLALSGVGPNVATEILSLWNMKNQPPLPRDELETSVKSVYRTAKHRTNVAEVKNGAPNPVRNSFDLMSFDSYMTKFYGEEQKWLISKWMPESTIAFIVSPPGGHKTWLLLDLAVSVASGSHFLGMYPVMDKGPVIIIQQEDFHGQIVERLSLIVHNRFGLSHSEDELYVPPKLPIFVHPDRKLKFSDEKVMKALDEQIDKIRPKLVIIDPLYSAAAMDNYMADTASEMFAIKAMRDKYGTAFIVAHHTKKGADGDRERAWGSQFLNAFLETGWQIKSKTDGNISIRRHFKQFADQREVGLKFEIDTEDAYHYKVKEVVGKDEKDKPTKVEIDEIEKREKETKQIVSGSREMMLVMETIRTADTPISIYDIMNITKIKMPQVKSLLAELLAVDMITQSGKTYTWKGVA